jgi:hypothetical protein
MPGLNVMFLDLVAAKAAVDNAEDRAYRRAYSALSTSPGVLWWFVWFYQGYSVGALWPFLLVESLPGVSTSFLLPHLALAALRGPTSKALGLIRRVNSR